MPRLDVRRGQRLAAALLLGLIAILVGASRVSVDFKRERHLLVTSVTQADAAGSVVKLMPTFARPVSVVVAHATGRDSEGPVELRLDGRVVGRGWLRAGPDRRLDFQVLGGIPSGSRLEVTSTVKGWTLGDLQVANLHGFTSGLIAASVVPAQRGDYARLPRWLLLPIALVLFALGLVGPASSASRQRVELAAIGVGLVPLAIALLVPRFSRFAVVLSVQTWLQCLVLMFGARAQRAYVAARQWANARDSRIPGVMDGVVVVVLVTTFFVSATVHGLSVRDGDYSRFLFLDVRHASAPVLDSYPAVRESLATCEPPGYDGQFMYLMAFDPLLTAFEPGRYLQVVDSPPYRYGRIGFSALTWVFSAGNPARYPKTMIWLIVISHAVSAIFLVLLARQSRAPVWLALTYLLVPGFIVSLACALPESLAAALLLAGLWAYRDSRRWLAVACLAAGLMVRETGVVVVVMLAAWEWWAALPTGGSIWRWTPARRRAVQLLLALAPVALWRLYVGWRLYPGLGPEAFLHNPHDLTVPFLGFLDLWSINDAAHGLGQVYNIYYPVLLIALLILAAWMLVARGGPLAAAALVYALIAVSLNVEKIWHAAGNAERGTFEAFVVLLVAGLPFRDLPRPLRAALIAVATATFVYDFQFGTYSHWYRPALVIFK